MIDYNTQHTADDQDHSSGSAEKKVFFKRRKVCPLSSKDAPVIDYKNPDLLYKFVSEGGRILPSRITNVCAKKQRMLKRAIKQARILALLPFVGDCSTFR